MEEVNLCAADPEHIDRGLSDESSRLSDPRIAITPENIGPAHEACALGKPRKIIAGRPRPTSRRSNTSALKRQRAPAFWPKQPVETDNCRKDHSSIGFICEHPS
jgi:hypothetical protein